MKTRDDFIRKLREDQRYREALGRARSPVERKIISELVERFVGDAGQLLGPAIDRASHDPSFAAMLGKALIEGCGVVNNDQTPTSGSKA